VVCEEDQAQDLIESLVAKNLVRALASGASHGEVRVGLFETIREFGLEQLAWTGELEPLQRRHAENCLALAERAEPGLGGPQIRMWLDLLNTEHENLRAALREPKSTHGSE
jgi:predicted ATPase